RQWWRPPGIGDERPADGGVRGVRCTSHLTPGRHFNLKNSTSATATCGVCGAALTDSTVITISVAPLALRVYDWKLGLSLSVSVLVYGWVPGTVKRTDAGRPTVRKAAGLSWSPLRKPILSMFVADSNLMVMD